jgi:hypothetical protein
MNHNFTNPRYKSKFWFYLTNPTLWFGFEQRLSDDLINVIGDTILLERAAYNYSTRFHRYLLYRVWGRKFIHIKEKPYSTTIINGSPRRWGIRLAGTFLSQRGVRWYHTSRVLNHPLPSKIHPLTMNFITKNPYAILGLIQHPTSDYGKLQQLSKKLLWPSPQKLYKTPNQNIINESRAMKLTETLEVNLVMRFKQLAQNGVIIGTYNSMKIGLNIPN